MSGYQWYPVGNPLSICGAGEGFVLGGKAPGHVTLGDPWHRDVLLQIEWEDGYPCMATVAPGLGGVRMPR